MIYRIFLNPKNNLKTTDEYTELLKGYSGIREDVTMFVPPLLVEDVTENNSAENVRIGVQGLRISDAGGTGAVDPKAVLALGITTGLVGHSDERRAGMTPAEVLRVVKESSENMTLVVCVGELSPKEDDMKKLYEELDVLKKNEINLRPNMYLAYEPEWLISTNKDDLFDMEPSDLVTHCARTVEHIKSLGFEKVLYGGSVGDFTPDDLKQFGVDGFLIGSLSLKPVDLQQFITNLK